MMPPFRVLLVDDDARSRSALTYGFERDKVTVAGEASLSVGLDTLAARSFDVVIANLTDPAGHELVRRARRELGSHVPIILVTDRGARKAGLADGATDVLDRPAFLRDIVALARINRTRDGVGVGMGGRAGDLAELAGAFHVLRALGAARRSGTLTMVRGLRRAEVTLADGDIDSVRLGVLSGLAALFHVILWQEGRFELSAERSADMCSDASLAGGLKEAEEVLRDAREVAKNLTFSAVYEQDLRRIAECVDTMPRGVGPTLRLFDGCRTLADVVDDSPLRPLETLKVAARLLEMAALRRIGSPRPHAGAKAALAIEDWAPPGSETERAAATKVNGSAMTEAGAPVATVVADSGAAPADRSGESQQLAVAPAQAEIVPLPPILPTGASVVHAPAAALAAGSLPSLPLAVLPHAAASLAPGRNGSPVGDVAVAVQDAARFDDFEEEFFRQALNLQVEAPVENFDDLDEGMPVPPVGFWSRLFGAGSPSPAPAHRKAVKAPAAKKPVRHAPATTRKKKK